MERKESVLAELAEGFKGISVFADKFFDISDRADPGKPITAVILNDYMISHGYKSIGTSWIELSRRSAEQHMASILRAEQTGSFDTSAPKELPVRLSKVFVNFFGESGRFFCNGLVDLLDEYPLTEPGRISTEVLSPFESPSKRFGQYGAFSSLTESPLESPFGVVAIDKDYIGYMLVMPETC